MNISFWPGKIWSWSMMHETLKHGNGRKKKRKLKFYDKNFSKHSNMFKHKFYHQNLNTTTCLWSSYKYLAGFQIDDDFILFFFLVLHKALY